MGRTGRIPTSGRFLLCLAPQLSSENTARPLARMDIKSRLAPDDGPSTALLKFMEAAQSEVSSVLTTGNGWDAESLFASMNLAGIQRLANIYIYIYMCVM